MIENVRSTAAAAVEMVVEGGGGIVEPRMRSESIKRSES